MKLHHKVVIFTWCACLIFFLLPSFGNSVLPCASSGDTNFISESDRFTQYTYIITIDVTATTNENCHPSELVKSSTTCKSLNHALQVYGGISSVVFNLVASDEVYLYTLNFTYNVTNQHNIWFRIYGNSSSWPQASIPTITCLEGAGLAISLVNSSNISFSS
jgi:hypothetical protein